MDRRDVHQRRRHPRKPMPVSPLDGLRSPRVDVEVNGAPVTLDRDGTVWPGWARTVVAERVEVGRHRRRRWRRSRRPGCRPAIAAGDEAVGASMAGQCGSLKTVSAWKPKTATNSTSATSRFMAGPAEDHARPADRVALLRGRCGARPRAGPRRGCSCRGCARRRRAGTAFRPYSVSPRRKLQMRGPKPTKNSVTFMPACLAAR